jgi:hypothetical protein
MSIGGIAFITLNYVDPPVTDPLVFGFVKSNRYLPQGDSFRREELYSPLSKLLAEDRQGYSSILYLSGVALLSALGLYFATARLGKNLKSGAAVSTTG